MNGNTFSYYYDGDGLRHYKKVNGNRTFYYYKDGRIIAQFGLDTNERIFYFYDSMGIAGMSYSAGGIEQNYYFIKNTLGDVLAIQNESGTVVAWYEYDAWGNIVYQYGEMSYKNPFRYRGYYYDWETGFYYLQTRYYDPTICRFINADNPELLTTLAGVAGQLNLYAYCNNNPVMLTDETGEFFWTALLIGTIAGMLIGGTVSAVTAVNSGETGWELAGSIAEGLLVGGATGAAAGALVGLAPTIGAGLGTMTSGAAGATATASVASTYVVAAGATVALGTNLFFSSSNRPGNNKRQNKQFKDAMKELGITNKDQMRRVHNKIKGRNMGYNDLIEFIKQVLNLG